MTHDGGGDRRANFAFAEERNPTDMGHSCKVGRASASLIAASQSLCGFAGFISGTQALPGV